MGKVEFCFVDAKGIHNKLFDNADELKKAMEDVARLRPNSPTSLLGKNKVTGKPHRVTKGNFNWSDTELTVEISFGGRETFTYRTTKYVDIGDGFQIKTRRGISYGVVASECRRKTKTDIANIASFIGYKSLVLLQDVIAKEESK